MSNGYAIPFEDKLKCSICQDRLKDARSLPCGHTYCAGCLQNGLQASYHRTHIQCSECQKSSRIPIGGVEGLPRCFILNQLLDDINQTFRPGNAVTISNHGFQAKETFTCSICLSTLGDARYLPCGHCFCTGCLTKQSTVSPGRVKCSKCQRDHPLPAGGVAGLAMAYRINSITDVIRANEDPQSDCNQSNGHGVGYTRHQPCQRSPRPSTTVMEDVEEAKKRAQAQIQVFVQQMNGKSVTININVNDSVATLKRQIEAKTRLTPSQQSLSYSGKNLDQNSQTLQYYGIGNHATIQLNGRLRGGNQIE